MTSHRKYIFIENTMTKITAPIKYLNGKIIILVHLQSADEELGIYFRVTLEILLMGSH